MNCKQGDLAVVVRAKRKENLGKILRCVRLHTDKWRDADGRQWSDGPHEAPRWVVDKPVPNTCGVNIFTVPDAVLRPIRPNEGEDETFQWAGKPKEVTA
jgi:hypothetical protein